MYNGSTVHVCDPFAYLTNEQNAVSFSQREVISHNTFEKLSSSDAVMEYVTFIIDYVC